MTPTPPLIPGYTVHGLLGQGGMAEVWLATQESLRRKVALKLLLDTTDDQFTRRFIREAHTVASLHHPAIVTIHDIGQLADGRHYLAMEFLGGGDLAQFKGHALPPNRVLAIARQVAAGLDIIHDKGLVHRDLKPANLLFRDPEHVVISDFGIARNPDIDSDLTQEGVVVGSPAYSSPEQSQCQPLDRRSDLYSLGVILAELLLGRNPYRGDSYAATVANHLHQPPPDLPAPLRAWQPVLARLLAKDPAQRYANGRELTADLDRLEQLPAPAARPSPLARLTRRQRLGVAGVVVAGLLAAAWPTASRHYNLWQQLRQGDAALQANRPDEAETFFRQALAVDAGNAYARAGLERVRQARVNRLLALAEQRLAEQKLSEPAKDNAIAYFRQAAALAPGDVRPAQGLLRVASVYAGLAKDAADQGNTDRALTLVKAGLDARPDHPELLALRDKLSTPPAGADKTPARSKPSSRNNNPVRRFFKKLWG